MRKWRKPGKKPTHHPDEPPQRSHNMTFTIEQLKAAHKHASRNQDAINKSTLCGCFYCEQVYPASDVEKYTYPQDALCPKCGIDSVLADADGQELTEASFLKAMYEHWFETSED
jgi:hypothetical protein